MVVHSASIVLAYLFEVDIVLVRWKTGSLFTSMQLPVGKQLQLEQAGAGTISEKSNLDFFLFFLLFALWDKESLTYVQIILKSYVNLYENCSTKIQIHNCSKNSLIQGKAELMPYSFCVLLDPAVKCCAVKYTAGNTLPSMKYLIIN